MPEHVTLSTDDPTVTVALTLGTIVGSRCIDAGSHDEPPTYEPVTLLDAIVDRAAGCLVQDIIENARQTLRSRVTEIRDEMIREHLQPAIDAAIDEPIQRTNEYGVKRGEPITMRQLVIDAVHAEAANALKRTNARYDSERTVLDRLLAETVPKVLTKELAAEVTAAKAQLRDAVATSAAQVMADALSNVISK